MFRFILFVHLLAALLLGPAQPIFAFVHGALYVAPTTFDPLNTGSDIVLSNGNLTATSNETTDSITRATANSSSGKYYYEITITTVGQNPQIGLVNSSVDAQTYFYLAYDGNSVGLYATGNVYVGSSEVGYGAVFSNGSIIGVAIDLGNQTIWFTNDGTTWNGSGGNNPATNTGGLNISSMLTSAPYYPAAGLTVGPDVLTVNFGATSYAYTVPSGFGNWSSP
jgi:hypothetical protein